MQTSALQTLVRSRAKRTRSKRRPIFAEEEIKRLALDVKAKKRRLERVLETLLPIEKAEEQRCRTEIQQLDLALKKSISRRQRAVYINNKERRRREVHKKFKGRFHELSLEPLELLNEDGFPRLVVFRLEDPNFKLESIRGQSSIKPVLPKPIATRYRKALERLALKRGSYYWGSISLTCAFTGLIPIEVKETIRNVEKEFKTIFIVAEPKEWELNGVVGIPKGDPLVVGWDGFHLWLIADFDTTTYEDQMFFAGPPKRRRKKSVSNRK